jgi:cytochrome c-type biogenesis protein CcmH/NrfF
MRRLYRIFASLLGVVLVAVLAMGAADDSGRFNDISHKLMCTCGCGQVLGECNHLGCPSLTRESDELQSAINRGDSDNAILIAFQNEYGPTVLAAPMLTKFNTVAWIVPPAALLLGILGTVVLVRRWRLRVAAQPVAERGPAFQAMREKIRRETQL